MTDLPLHKISETPTTITLGWTPVAGAVGYRFQSAATAPKWSHTWSATRDRVTFAKGQEPYIVQALGVEAAGEWPNTPTPAPAGILGWGAEEQAKARGSWQPARTVLVRTRQEFRAAWNSLRDNDRIDATPMPPLYGEYEPLGNKSVATRAEVIGLKHAGGPFGLYPLVYRCFDLSNLERIHFYDTEAIRTDGETKGACFLIDGCKDVSWWGVAKNGPSGGGAHYNTDAARGSQRVDMRGLVENCATVAGDIGHPDEPGTGVHGFYLGGSPGFSDDCLLSYAMKGIHSGAGIQAGHHVRSTSIYLDCRDNDAPRPTFYVAGNALQFWGDYIENIRVPYIYAEDCTGRVVEGDGIYGSVADGAIVVEYGRGKNCLLDLRHGLVDPWRYFDTSDAAIRYVDISPP